MDASLTTASYLVLGLVRFAGKTSPYELKAAAAREVGPFWSLPHTQVYVQCDKLVEAGLLRQEQQSGGRQKRILTLTEDGGRELDSWLEQLTFVPAEARELGILKLYFGADPQTLGPEQISNHEQTLQRYQNLLDELRPILRDGQRRALEFGIAYERMILECWQRWTEEAERP